jgi:hypothetical protein
VGNGGRGGDGGMRPPASEGELYGSATSIRHQTHEFHNKYKACFDSSLGKTGDTITVSVFLCSSTTRE